MTLKEAVRLAHLFESYNFSKPNEVLHIKTAEMKREERGRKTNSYKLRNYKKEIKNGGKCYNCNKYGHFAKDCRSKNKLNSQKASKKAYAKLSRGRGEDDQPENVKSTKSNSNSGNGK